METRLAVVKDLPKLKTMFDKIVKVMEANNVFIWNEDYPYEEFENDIQTKNLYVSIDDSKIDGSARTRPTIKSVANAGKNGNVLNAIDMSGLVKAS